VGPKWLTDALSGKVSLARAFWLYGFGVSVGYSAIGAFIDVTHTVAITIYLVLGLVVGLVQTVILWRSAKNSPSRFLGRLVRILVIVGLLMIPVMIYLLYTGSAALLPVDVR
jgi:glucan phosphoethanolaminetransferase (alkaline phosphatase superfamily)